MVLKMLLYTTDFTEYIYYTLHGGQPATNLGEGSRWIQTNAYPTKACQRAGQCQPKEQQDKGAH